MLLNSYSLQRLAVASEFLDQPGRPASSTSQLDQPPAGLTIPSGFPAPGYNNLLMILIY